MFNGPSPEQYWSELINSNCNVTTHLKVLRKKLAWKKKRLTVELLNRYYWWPIMDLQTAIIHIISVLLDLLNLNHSKHVYICLKWFFTNITMKRSFVSVHIELWMSSLLNTPSFSIHIRIFSHSYIFRNKECIPVGWVPPAAVAITRGSPHPPEQAPPLVRSPSTSPLAVGLETPSQIPLSFPLWCGPGNLQGMLGYHPPLQTCCKACWDTTCNVCWDSTPLCGQNDRHV